MERTNTNGTLKTLLCAVLFACAGAPAMMLAGCEREGPAERAGEAVDETVDDIGDAIEDATDR